MTSSRSILDAVARPVIAASTIDFTHLLESRPTRRADYETENEALGRLANTLAEQPDKIARELAITAMRLTGADSAGLSLEEEVDGKRCFRWVATAGDFDRYINGTLPRHFSPCGEVLDRNEAILMRSPVKRYEYIAELHQPVQEVLLVPFHRKGTPIGTLWIISHSDEKTFDREDLRLVRGLTKFAAAAAQTVGLVDRLREENKIQEQALEAYRGDLERLRTWFAQAPGFAAILRGPDHIFEMANQAYCEMVGNNNLLGKPIMEALTGLRDHGFEELLDKVYTTGEVYVGRDVRVQFNFDPAESSNEKFLDFVYQPILNDENQVGGIFIQGFDCTERKRASDELRDVDQRKDQFLATLSHEMRSPLSAINLSIQLLKQLSVSDDARHHKSLNLIQRQTGQLLSLVNDITDISSIKNGRIALHKESLIAQDLVTKALEACSAALQEKQHHLDVDMPEAGIMLEGDGFRLTQVLINLLNNAIKYTPPGGNITIHIDAIGDVVQFRVVDSGIGIPIDSIPKIFDLFMQVPMPDRQSYSGLGIGLALARQLVHLHNGSVNVTSTGENQGSEFTVKLPRKPV